MRRAYTAKIGGITPEVLSFSGRCEDCPSNMRSSLLLLPTTAARSRRKCFIQPGWLPDSHRNSADRVPARRAKRQPARHRRSAEAIGGAGREDDAFAKARQ
jgi:hypothetical protein